jgi:hypothetical protein
MYRNLIMMLSICAASPVIAEERLYCVDTAVTGFKWDQGSAVQTNFTLHRFTITVSDFGPVITDIGEAEQIFLTCKEPLTLLNERAMCDDAYASSWIFFRGAYTRSYLTGPTVDGYRTSIVVAYGTCTKRGF